MKKNVLFLVLALLCFALALPAAAETADDRRITLSGNAEDTFVAQQDYYTEGEYVFLFFQKVLTVRGDMLAIVEDTMATL
ncbi:MAG: hypothetical protein E7316_01015 [Clostridiales bacterium]|nr:hypothetical protein [Clostridiales bacterium]